MIIAIDYDETYTKDPELFDEIIKLLQSKGHEIICVTGRRSDKGELLSNSIGKLVPLIFAGRQWKKLAAINAGYNVDIWVDDSPQYIANRECPTMQCSVCNAEMIRKSHYNLINDLLEDFVKCPNNHVIIDYHFGHSIVTIGEKTWEYDGSTDGEKYYQIQKEINEEVKRLRDERQTIA